MIIYIYNKYNILSDRKVLYFKLELENTFDFNNLEIKEWGLDF